MTETEFAQNISKSTPENQKAFVEDVRMRNALVSQNALFGTKWTVIKDNEKYIVLNGSNRRIGKLIL